MNVKNAGELTELPLYASAVGDLYSRPSKIELCESADIVISNVIKNLDMPIIDNNWHLDVSKIVVVLSASRSGSSLIFNALVNSNEVIAPLGEHEPWLFLTKNKFPFNSSDHLLSLRSKKMLLKLIRNDLVSRVGETSLDDIALIGRNRANIRKLLPNYGDIWPVENPPYVDVRFTHVATNSEITNSTLVFKSPSDAYRKNYFKILFPNADIKYVHLTRGFAQTVNGLMDGWLSNNNDFVSNPIYGLTMLGYPDSIYWRFDLFPEWNKHKSSDLLNVCVEQWLSAHEQIIENYNFNELSSLKFELIYDDKETLTKKLLHLTGIDTSAYKWAKPIMSTDNPIRYRWRKRADIFRNIQQYIPEMTYRRIVSLQNKMGYSMKEETWL